MAKRRGRGQGEDTASPRRIEAAERRAQALELRKAGATYEQIAQRLGYADRANAYRAVHTALKEITAEPAKEVIKLELERLDAMLLGLWPDARKGKPEAVDRVLRVMERRSKLLGLDSPVRADVSVHQTDATDTALAEILNEAKAKVAAEEAQLKGGADDPGR